MPEVYSPVAPPVLKVLDCISRGKSSTGQISLSPFTPLPLGFLKRIEKQIPRRTAISLGLMGAGGWGGE